MSIAVAIAAAASAGFFSFNLMPDASIEAADMPRHNLSAYSGQEVRAIKSLSDDDIVSLQNGTGEVFGGLAKPAELNGYPGPRHVLDMALHLGLTGEQKSGIEQVYDEMNAQARALGIEIIAAEKELDSAFANKTANERDLQAELDKSAHLHGQLRYVHLSAHLETMRILTQEQIDLYNDMRGYGHGDHAGS